ncbi:MAG: hypothetical protein WC756_17470 [Taibaiella sp.]|jgi:hypothetical protein
MKLLLILLATCSIAACKSVSENHPPSKEITKSDTTSPKKETVPAIATENNVLYLTASGFEPMWTLNLYIAQDGTYPVTFTTITEKMTGNLKPTADHTFEGIVKGGTKEALLKVVIADIPCQGESGKKDPQTVMITFAGSTSSGCGKYQ